MEPESATPILGLWVFSVAAAHIFAGYWLAQAFLLSHPGLKSQLKCAIKRLKPSKLVAQSHSKKNFGLDDHIPGETI